MMEIATRFSDGLANATVFFGMLAEGEPPETVVTLRHPGERGIRIRQLADKMQRRFGGEAGPAAGPLLAAAHRALIGRTG